MKQSKWICGALLTMLMLLNVMVLSAEARRERTARQSTAPLSADEAADLTFMREEEKLARDVYREMYEAWKMPIFANIAKSEERHTRQVLRLLTRYGIGDPVLSDEVGDFDNEELGRLYEQLVAQGSGEGSTLPDALEVGGLIEETDIVDLRVAIQNTTHADIKRVYSNLMEASKNHLRAFVGQMEAAGVTYTPALLSQEEFDAIVN